MRNGPQTDPTGCLQIKFPAHRRVRATGIFDKHFSCVETCPVVGTVYLYKYWPHFFPTHSRQMRHKCRESAVFSPDLKSGLVALPRLICTGPLTGKNPLSPFVCCRSQWRRSVAAHLLRLWVRIPPGAWMFVCCECCVLSGRGLCDELMTRPEEFYQLWCVIVCDLETSWMRRPWPTGGCRAKNKQTKTFCLLAYHMQLSWLIRLRLRCRREVAVLGGPWYSEELLAHLSDAIRVNPAIENLLLIL